MYALKEHGGLYYTNVITKLMSLGPNGVNVFQGVNNGVTHIMQNKNSLHLKGIHCMAHYTNLSTSYRQVTL
jgi:hypothetical protein